MRVNADVGFMCDSLMCTASGEGGEGHWARAGAKAPEEEGPCPAAGPGWCRAGVLSAMHCSVRCIVDACLHIQALGACMAAYERSAVAQPVAEAQPPYMCASGPRSLCKHNLATFIILSFSTA